MDFIPEGTGTDLREPGVRASVVALLTLAAQMERRTWGDGEAPWTGPVESMDFSGWLAGVLAEVAENVGGPYELVAGRPGSWESDLVLRLLSVVDG